jgi:hypothetical protein
MNRILTAFNTKGNKGYNNCRVIEGKGFIFSGYINVIVFFSST